MNDINYASIQKIHTLYKEKKLTVRELVLKYLSKIAEIDSCENGLNSVLEINPDAICLALSFFTILKSITIFIWWCSAITKSPEIFGFSLLCISAILIIISDIITSYLKKEKMSYICTVIIALSLAIYAIVLSTGQAHLFTA